MFYQTMLFIGGLLVVTGVSFDVFQSVIVPRMTSRRLRLAPFLIGKIAWPIHREFAKTMAEPLQSGYLEVFAALGFVLLMLIWFMLLILGYGMMLLALGK